MTGTWGAALLSPPFATLSYLPPLCFAAHALRQGMRFIAPVGNSLRVVVLLRQEDAPPAGDTTIVFKPLLWPLERRPLLHPEYLGMIEQLAVRQMSTPGKILGSLLPLPLRSAQVKFSVPVKGRNKFFKPQDIRALSEDARRALAQDWNEGRMQVHDAAIHAQDVVTVVQDPPWPVRPAAVRQIAVLEYLWERGGASKKTLFADCGEGARNALPALLQRGLVKIGPPQPPHDEESPQPEEGRRSDFQFTQEQLAAIEGEHGLDQALRSPEGETRLLFGITGSGKTAVYLDLARRALEMGRSVYVLAPEIALAQNLRRAVLERFAPEREVLFYHGYQSPQERAKTFRQASMAGDPVIVVGTRSALFLPVPHPGCVILDEEHDSSFKQDERLTYQAKEIGYFMMRQHNGLLLLGSATPDVKTFYAAEQGFAPALCLSKRISDCGLPRIDLVDIRNLGATEHLLAPETIELLRDVVARGEQAIIMLNRRGYSPLMYCLECGRVAKCPNCEIGLTYHKGRERLICHYCGESRPFPLICEGCGGCNYLPMGEGTQRLEETLETALPPGAGVLRLDRDSTRRPGRMEEILQAFARREAQVLVGTQMLSKGHHFPDVTQVVVADGDLGLNLPDYRAMERTFQLLVQVAGRAGRGDKPGRVLIQTRDMTNSCWSFVRNCDYTGFYHNELALRRKRNYPPFIKLALIRISYPMEWSRGGEKLTELARVVREAGRAHGVQVLGPAPAPLKQLRGRKRFHCLLKAQSWLPIRDVYGAVAQIAVKDAELRLSLDLDPVDML